MCPAGDGLRLQDAVEVAERAARRGTSALTLTLIRLSLRLLGSVLEHDIRYLASRTLWILMYSIITLNSIVVLVRLTSKATEWQASREAKVRVYPE